MLMQSNLPISGDKGLNNISLWGSPRPEPHVCMVLLQQLPIDDVGSQCQGSTQRVQLLSIAKAGNAGPIRFVCGLQAQHRTGCNDMRRCIDGIRWQLLTGLAMTYCLIKSRLRQDHNECSLVFLAARLCMGQAKPRLVELADMHCFVTLLYTWQTQQKQLSSQLEAVFLPPTVPHKKT